MRLPNHGERNRWPIRCPNCGEAESAGHPIEECVAHLRDCVEAIAAEMGDRLSDEEHNSIMNEIDPLGQEGT